MDATDNVGLVMSALDHLAVGTPLQEVFDLVVPAVGAVAGIFGVASEDGRSFAGRALRLPPHLLTSWMSTPERTFQQTLAPIARAPDGEVLLVSETVGPVAASSMPVLEDLHCAGFGGAAGYKLFQKLRGPLPADHAFLALMKEKGADFTQEDRVALRRLHLPLCRALARSSLPLVSHAPILDQIVAQENLGYICVARTGRLLELNRTAATLVARHGGNAGATPFDQLDNFASACIRKGPGRPCRFLSLTPPAVLTTRTYLLTRDTHVLPEDAYLLVLQETGVGEQTGLSPRERQIALLLAYTSLTYEQIAAQTGIKVGTLRVHVWRTYKKLNVETREDLACLLRGAAYLPRRG